jgi:hypothetical protein
VKIISMVYSDGTQIIWDGKPVKEFTGPSRTVGGRRLEV